MKILTQHHWDASLLFDAQGLRLESTSTPQFLEFEGARLAFDYEPAASGYPPSRLLVLVNGYQRTRLDFRALRKRLKTLDPGLATLALDNRGCGETRFLTPEDAERLSVEQMARDVACLASLYCQRLELPNYATLGISMGGMISQVLAAGNPWVSHLLLVSTTAGGQARTWPTDDGRAPEGLTYRNWPQDEEAMRRRMHAYFGPRFHRNSPLLFDMMVKNMLKGAAQPESEGRSRLQFYASAGFDGVALLPLIGAKVLVVTGADDAVIPVANADTLEKLIPGSQKRVYPEVGHLILIEEPDRFARDVVEFLGA